MNPINAQICKELWDNFDKCDWEAWLTEPSAMLVCVHSPSLHTQKRGKRWVQCGAGGDLGRKDGRGRGSVQQDSYSAVGYAPQKIKRKNRLSDI